MDEVQLPHDGRDRRYLLCPPAAPARPPAVVVFLPGTGGTAEWTADETRLPAFAAAAGFALAVPEALRPRPDLPPKFLTNPPRWNDGNPPPTAEHADDADDVGFLTCVIDDALARTGGDPRRVYVTGFSNGAGMAFRLAAEASHRVAAVAPVAGHCPPALPPLARPVPTLFIIGARDPLVPPRGGLVELPWGNKLARRPPVVTSLERWAAAINAATVSRVVAEGGGVVEEVFPGPAEFRAVTVDGLGHHWPGGRGQFNPRIGGPPSDALDANARLWDFFQRHTL